MSAAAAGPQATRTTVVGVVVAMTIAQAASTMGTAVFPVIAPPLAAEIGVTPAAIGYLVSLAFGVAAVLAPFTSFAVPRFGAARCTQVGLLACALAMVTALAASIPMLAVTALLLGVGTTLITPASGHLLFRFGPPEKRNLIFSIKQTGVPGGWVIVALAAPALAVNFGWRFGLVLVLVMALATAASLQRVRAHWDDDRKPTAGGWMNPAHGLRLIWRYPVLRWLAVASFFLTFVQLCLGTFLVSMLVAEADYTLIAAGVMLSVVQASGLAGRIVFGWLADRTGDAIGVLQKLAGITAVCCIVTPFIDGSWPPAAIVVLFAVFGLASVGWNGVFLAELAHASPRGMVSVATSAAMAWNFGGILVGPALFAATYTAIGSYTQTYGWMTSIALCGVAMLTLARAARRRERQCSNP